MRGFLAIDKPPGRSSHDMVAVVRRAAGIKKVGHAGTLDPMATGLLVVAIGPATRLISWIQDAEKEYVATARFGVATDSLDADGKILSEEPLPVTRTAVEEVLPRFRGRIEQVPPMVSALKKDGKRLYELAREGTVIEREPRPVTIHELEVIDFADGPFPEMTFRVVCSKGTYVRSLGDDIAVALGGRAHLTALRRTRIGATSVTDAVDPATLTLDGVLENLIEPAAALPMLPRLVVDDDTAQKVSTGRPIPPSGIEVAVDTEVAVVDSRGRLLAVYRSAGTQLLPRIVLPT